jgi:hypothetical protein
LGAKYDKPLIFVVVLSVFVGDGPERWGVVVVVVGFVHHGLVQHRTSSYGIS